MLFRSLTGWAYAREDVTAKAIANAYAAALGSIFTEQMKPFEVEVLVAQIGDTAESDEMYRVTYDGTLRDEHGFMATGGHEEALRQAPEAAFVSGMDLAGAVQLGAKALTDADPSRPLAAANLEVALLDRSRPKRAFRRLLDPEVEQILQTSA